jgi:hypothetical protein
VTLKVKFSDFEIITRSRSVPAVVSSRAELERLSVSLLQAEVPVPKPVRLLRGLPLIAPGRRRGGAATRVADLTAWKRSRTGCRRVNSDPPSRHIHRPEWKGVLYTRGSVPYYGTYLGIGDQDLAAHEEPPA